MRELIYHLFAHSRLYLFFGGLAILPPIYSNPEYKRSPNPLKSLDICQIPNNIDIFVDIVDKRLFWLLKKYAK